MFARAIQSHRVCIENLGEIVSSPMQSVPGNQEKRHSDRVAASTRSKTRRHLLAASTESSIHSAMKHRIERLSDTRQRAVTNGGRGGLTTSNAKALYTEHLVAHVLLMRTACQIVIVTHSTSCLAQVQDEALCVVQNSSHCTFDERHTFTWHLHSFPHNDTTLTSSNFLSSETNPCADPQEVSIGYLADPTTRTGYEPKDLVENEDPRVKPLFFHHPIASTGRRAACEMWGSRRPQRATKSRQKVHIRKYCVPNIEQHFRNGAGTELTASQPSLRPGSTCPGTSSDQH